MPDVKVSRIRRLGIPHSLFTSYFRHELVDTRSGRIKVYEHPKRTVIDRILPLPAIARGVLKYRPSEFRIDRIFTSTPSLQAV